MRWHASLVAAAVACALSTALSTARPPPTAAPLDARLPPPPKRPPVWPDVVHAVLWQEDEPKPGSGDAAGGAVVDLWYDFKNKRNANVIRARLSRSTLADVEHGNGTSFFFDRAARTCKTVHFPVGVLRPDWLAGAAWHGRRTVDGVACDLWAKAGFVEYWARAGDGVPVQWRFSADAGGPMLMRVLRWEPGVEWPEEEWQAPAYCF